MNRKSCYLQGVFNIWAKGRVIVLVGLCMLFTSLNTKAAQAGNKIVEFPCQKGEHSIQIEAEYSGVQFKTGCICGSNAEDLKSLLKKECQKLLENPRYFELVQIELPIPIEPGQKTIDHVTFYCVTIDQVKAYYKLCAGHY